MRPHHIFILSIIGILVAIEAWFIIVLPPTSSYDFVKDSADKYPLIVLYRGKAEGEKIEWNTGVWPGWGVYEGNRQNKTIERKLKWAADGVIVKKTCDVPCYITHDQEQLPKAHGVVMELVNHPKFYSNRAVPIPWPEKYSYARPSDGEMVAQKWVLFYYEPWTWYEKYVKGPAILGRFDLTAIPEQTADLPVTLVCTWGRERSDFLAPPPPKASFACDFSSGAESRGQDFFSRLRSALSEQHRTVDSFKGPFRNREPEPSFAEGNEAFVLGKRIDKMGQYKFTFLTESIILNDWLSPEWSQIFLGGSVPVYFGAQNIDDYAPGPNSFINAAQFSSPEELANHLIYLDEHPEEYQKLFDWKKQGLSRSFETHLDNCVHIAECRLCHAILAADKL